MKKLPLRILVVGFSAGLAFFAPGEALAQQAKQILKIRDVKTDEVETPEYETRNLNLNLNFSSSKDKKWQQIQVLYETSEEWVDQLDFEFYALMENPKATGRDKFKIAKGKVSYVNVARGKHISVAYIQPGTLERYGKVERVAVVIKSKGALAGMESEPKSKSRWWEQLPPNEDWIKDRTQTPFSLIDWDLFEDIKSGGPTR